MNRLQPAIGYEVAAAFETGRSTPGDPRVAAAYADLERQSDSLFAWLTRHAPDPVRVVFSCCRLPYDDEWQLVADVTLERHLEVTTSATERDRIHPLLGCRPGGAYDRFRAVHDIVGHAAPHLGFDRQGEYAAWLTQDRLYHGLARGALATELHGEHSVRWTTGEVAEHKALLLDASLLRCSIACAATSGRGRADGHRVTPTGDRARRSAAKATPVVTP